MKHRSLWVLMAAAFVDMMGFAMVFPLLPFYAQRLGGADWIIGPMIASFSIAQLASAPLWGRLSDRLGRRPVLVIGLTSAAIGYFIFGLADSVWLLFLSRIVQGAGGGTTGVIQAYVSDSTEASQRAHGLGWLSAATSAGVMIGPAIGSLAAHWGPAAPGVMAGLLCLGNVAFAWRYLPESRPVHATSAPRQSVRAAMWRVFRHPTAPQPRLIWIYASGMGAFASMSAVVALYLGSRFGVTERTIGWVFVYIGALSVVLRAVILGKLVDRFGETRVMRAGAVLLTLGLALYPLPDSLWTMALVIPLVPAGTALLFPSVTALATHRSPSQEVGQAMGVQQAFGGLARVVGPMWATPAYQVLGRDAPFAIAAALMAIVLLQALRVPDARAAPVPATAPGD